MHVEVVINERAGTLVGADAEAMAATVVKAFETAGHRVECTIIHPAKLLGAVRLAVGQRPDALVVGGGDGTVRSAASALLGTGIALGVLPLGTMNRLARDLGLPLDPVAAAAVLAKARVTPIDVGEVNGRLFLCNSMLGVPLRFSAERKRLRGKPIGERVKGYASAVAGILTSRHRTAFRIDDGKTVHKLRALSLVVSSNGYAEEMSLMLRRARLDGGELAVYASRHASGWGMARAVARAMLGRMDGDENVVRLSGTNLTIGMARSRVKVSNDGEIEVLHTPLCYRVLPRALGVMTPRQA